MEENKNEENTSFDKISNDINEAVLNFVNDNAELLCSFTGLSIEGLSSYLANCVFNVSLATCDIYDSIDAYDMCESDGCACEVCDKDDGICEGCNDKENKE